MSYADRRTRNQHDVPRITQREADTIRRCIEKIMKIANRNNLSRTDRSNLHRIVSLLFEALDDAGRGN